MIFFLVKLYSLFYLVLERRHGKIIEGVQMSCLDIGYELFVRWGLGLFVVHTTQHFIRTDTLSLRLR